MYRHLFRWHYLVQLIYVVHEAQPLAVTVSETRLIIKFHSQNCL